MYKIEDNAKSVRLKSHLANLVSYTYVTPSPPQKKQYVVGGRGGGVDRMLLSQEKAE
jgi:hypothetical protein